MNFLNCCKKGSGREHVRWGEWGSDGPYLELRNDEHRAPVEALFALEDVLREHSPSWCLHAQHNRRDARQQWSGHLCAMLEWLSRQHTSLIRTFYTRHTSCTHPEDVISHVQDLFSLVHREELVEIGVEASLEDPCLPVLGGRAGAA